MPSFQDQHLVLRVERHKDPDAFTELHSRYYPKIYGFIAFKISRREDAEDLASQVFLEVWKYLTQPVRGRGKIENFRAFIYKVARNKVVDFYRTQGKLPKTVTLNDPEEYLEIADEREDILSKQLQTQDLDSLIECVQKLPKPYREILALRFFEELEIQEIAEIIEKTLGNTRVLIHRGIKSLAAIMGKNEK